MNVEQPFEPACRSKNKSACLADGVRKRRSDTHAKILIVDDHEVVRQGVRAMILRSRPEWEISGEAATGSEALQAIQSLRPDVVVLDITMPDMSGIEVALQVARLHLPAALLMFTMHESSRLLGEIRNVGAQGFVNKSCAGRDLIAAIDALLAGGTFFREGVADVAPEPGDKPNPGLSFRQQLSLRLRRA